MFVCGSCSQSFVILININVVSSEYISLGMNENESIRFVIKMCWFGPSKQLVQSWNIIRLSAKALERKSCAFTFCAVNSFTKSIKAITQFRVCMWGYA